MSTQLRLVDPPEPGPRPTKAAAKAANSSSGRPRRTASRSASGRTTTGRIRTAQGGARRAASWGDWRLDAGTRRVGKAGVAAAREALEAALEQTALDQDLSQAS